MAIFRSYLAAQASLIRNNGTNASRNPIVELSYGGGTDGASAQVSRFLFRPSLEALRAEVATGRLRRSDVRRHEVFFKNVVALVPELVRGEVEDARRGNGTLVYLRALAPAEPFEEGKGFDYFYTPGLSLQAGADQQAANWYYRTNGQRWATPGAWDPATGQTLASCRVAEGTEDLRFDVTAYIQGVLFDGAPETGLLLQLDAPTEALLLARRHVITFFSRHTHHFFEPYLETAWTPQLQEYRQQVPLDEPSSLFLQVPADVANLSVESVSVTNGAGKLVASVAAVDVLMSRPGLFAIGLSLGGDLCTDAEVLTDTWVVNQAGRRKQIQQHFTVVDRVLMPLVDSLDRIYSLGVSGLRHNEVISRGQAPHPRRVVVSYRRLENGQITAGGCPPHQVSYRLYCPQGKEQIEVIPPTDCYAIGGALFFELDPRWLVPQHYVLELLASGLDGQQQGAPLVLKFRVVN